MSNGQNGANSDGGVQDGGVLRLTADGLEMPEMLKGYVGQFEIRTPTVTGQYSTTDRGLPDTEFYNGPIAYYPDAGDYNAHLDEGEIIVQARGHRDTLFRIRDERADGDTDE